MGLLGLWCPPDFEEGGGVVGKTGASGLQGGSLTIGESETEWEVSGIDPLGTARKLLIRKKKSDSY
jgi:hypothetical protein